MLTRQVVCLSVDNHQIGVVWDSKGQRIHGKDTAKGLTRGAVAVLLDGTYQVMATEPAHRV